MKTNFFNVLIIVALIFTTVSAGAEEKVKGGVKWRNDPAEFARLFFADSPAAWTKEGTKEAKKRPDIEEKVKGEIVEWPMIYGVDPAMLVLLENQQTILKQGTIDENSIGAFKGRVLDRIIRDHGMDAGRSFIDNVTRMGVAAITIFGFTTAIDDEDIPEEAKRQIQEGLEKAMKKISGLVKAYENEELESLPGRSIEETLEMEIMRVTGRARDLAGEIAGKHLGLNNSAVIMAKSGARGSMLNLSQMSGCVGQQAVRGERIHRGYQYRTLPHFKKGDLGAFAKGFVASSYKTGLTPTEYFFHSMGGREGLVDTAVRTSRSGYMQRRLINALEDVKVENDGTVRHSGGQIIQFKYGEDGIDPARSLNGNAVDINRIITDIKEGN